MTAADPTVPSPGMASTGGTSLVERHRWSISLAAVVGAHLLALPLLLNLRQTPPPPPPAPALLVDLAPLPPAPKPLPAPVAMPVPKPTPRPTIKPVVKPVSHPVSHPVAKPLATPQPILPPPPVPAPVAPVPAVATARATLASAPAATPPAPSPPPAAGGGKDSFEGRVMALLNQWKRYPSQARARHQSGTAMVRFTIDRQGHVLSATLAHSSGVAALDDEAVALPRRADPLPAPPDRLKGDTVTLEIPVAFSLDRHD